jgi:hypothetical protein
MPAGFIPLCMLERMFPKPRDGILLSTPFHDDEFAPLILYKDAPPGTWIRELDHLNYEGDMAPVALRALARRRYEMRMERKAIRAYRYFRRMSRHADPRP